MTRRVVAVVVPASVSGLSDQLRLAMLEDVYETIGSLELVQPMVIVAADEPLRHQVRSVIWPGTETAVLPPGEGPLALRALRLLAGRLVDQLADGDDSQVCVVAADAPDLPGLLIGKLYRGLGSADVAVLPAEPGGLLAIAARAPLPSWLPDEGVDLDRDDALALLQAGAPRRTAVSVGPGWHRVRTTADVDRLDPGLEGWEVTRALMRR